MSSEEEKKEAPKQTEDKFKGIFRVNEEELLDLLDN
jgi:hypothetical protein